MLFGWSLCISDKWMPDLYFCSFSSSLGHLLHEVKDCLGSCEAERKFLRENNWCVGPVIKVF